jgi:hypothetical protein
LLKDDVIEVIGITRGANQLERLTFEGGHVDLNGMLDISDQVQTFETPELGALDPVALLADLLEDMHEDDTGGGEKRLAYPRDYPTTHPTEGEPTAAELYACGFPDKTTVQEINAAITERAEIYGIPIAIVQQEAKKKKPPDPRSFQLTRDSVGRLTYSSGNASVLKMYANLVANARGADPPLYPDEPFEEEGASGSDRGMAVPSPPGIKLPRNKKFMRQPRPVRTGSTAANVCFLLCTVPIVLVATAAALVSGMLPVLLVIWCIHCVYIKQGSSGQSVSLAGFMVMQVLAVLLLDIALKWLCGPLIGWPYDACLQACECTCSMGSVLQGLAVTDGYKLHIKPATPDQLWWTNCAAATDEATCLYPSAYPDDWADNGTMLWRSWSDDSNGGERPSYPPSSQSRQCDWDDEASVCSFKCERIFDEDYCLKTKVWGTANYSQARQYCSIRLEDEVQALDDGDDPPDEMVLSFMRMTALRETSAEVRCVDCRDFGDC